MWKSRWRGCVIGGLFFALGIQISVYAGLGDWKMSFMEETKRRVSDEVLESQSYLININQELLTNTQKIVLEDLEKAADEETINAVKNVDQLVETLSINLKNQTNQLIEKNKEYFNELTREQMAQIDAVIEKGILKAIPQYSYIPTSVTTSGALSLKVQQESQAVQDLYHVVLRNYNQSEDEVVKDYYKGKLQEVEKLYEIVQEINERME